MICFRQAGSTFENNPVSPFAAVEKIIQHITDPEILFYNCRRHPHFVCGVEKQFFSFFS
jgi:hypothetical protein